ncbi:MAG: alpha/beta fold hydrolase [Acidobacteriota bacterium]
MGPAFQAWSVDAPDPRLGQVRLTGALTEVPGSRKLVVLVHGLGGSCDSSYMLRAASLAEQLGVSALRLNLRGADRQGADLYHAGLSRDLDAVLSSPAFRGIEEVLLLGFSLGGHISLRYALADHDPRLRAVAAACTPRDLDCSVTAVDGPAGGVDPPDKHNRECDN